MPRILLTLESPENKAGINGYWLRDEFYTTNINVTLRMDKYEKKSQYKLKLNNKSNLFQYLMVNHKF